MFSSFCILDNITEIFYSLLWLMMDLVTVFLLYYAFLVPKQRKWNAIIFLGTLLGSVACSFIQNAPSIAGAHIWDIPSPMETAFSLAILFVGLGLLFDGPWYRRISIFMIGFAISLALEYFLLNRISTRNSLDLITFYWAYPTYGICVTAAKIVVFFLSWLAFGVCKRKAGSHTLVSWLLLAIPLPTVVLLLMVDFFRAVLNWYNINYSITWNGPVSPQLILAVIGSVFLVTFNGSALYLIHISEYSAKQKTAMDQLQQQMDIQLESYLALEKSYRDQRAAAHDFSHHINTIQALLEQGDRETLSEYVNQLQQTQTTRIFTVYSHHPIIDAILNQKHQTAREKGIDMQVKVNDLSGISIPLDHLAVLLSNLLDNAIEGCAEEKLIRMSFIAEDALFLSIDNTSAPVNIIDRQSRTSKGDPRQHGFGLKNVKMILGELQAEYTVEYRDGWFCFAAEIPFPKP